MQLCLYFAIDFLSAKMNSVLKMNKMKRKKAIVATICVVLIAATVLKQQKKENVRRWWVRPWLNKEKGNINLSEEFVLTDQEKFANFLRMDEKTFKNLLKKIEHRITKYSLSRETISAKNKLIITLRYLATGESFRSLMYNYRISESAISLFIPTVCESIYQELKNEYLKVPSTAAEWLEIARDFENSWNAPNVIGALDGKHIVIKAPTDQGSAYYNYKKQHSIVLLALVDAKYNFIYINVGMNGRLSDGGVFWESDLSQAILRNTLNFPEDRPLPGRTKPVPYVIVADAAFSLSNHILKPYPLRNMSREQRIFNYRLSRARRVVENAFGIVANRFRVLLNTIPLHPDKAKVITQACCVLHNFLNKESGSAYLGKKPDEIDKNYKFVYGLSRQNCGRPGNESINIREEFREYFNGCGQVPWQDDII